MYYRSKFSHYYENDSNICLFHSLTNQVVFGGKELKDLFLSFPEHKEINNKTKKSDNPSEISNFLLNKGILVEDSTNDNQLLESMINKGKNKHNGQLYLMYLIPTVQCNLRCEYCFVETNKDDIADMSVETAERSVEYFFNHSTDVKNRKIIFYGGEPLLNPDAVFAASDKALFLSKKENKKRKIKLSIISNGTKVTKTIAKEIAKRDISVSISIDGPEKIHDTNRKTIKGLPTFQKAMAAIDFLRNEGLTPSISCTLTPTSIESWDKILTFITEDLKVEGLGFNLLVPGPAPDERMTYVDDLKPTEALIRAFKVFRSQGIYEDRVMRRVKPFSSKSFHYKDCLGVGGQVVIIPNGSVGPCQGLLGEMDYFPLNIFSNFDESPYENELFREWTDRFPLNFTECLKCPALSICGGGCPIAALRETGSVWDIDRRICLQVKPIHEWLIWDLFEKNNNLKENQETSSTSGISSYSDSTHPPDCVGPCDCNSDCVCSLCGAECDCDCICECQNI